MYLVEALSCTLALRGARVRAATKQQLICPHAPKIAHDEAGIVDGLASRKDFRIGVERHGGAVEARGRLGQGAMFTMVFPRHPLVAEPVISRANPDRTGT